MGSIFSAALDRTAEGLDRWLGWDRPALPMRILMLVPARRHQGRDVPCRRRNVPLALIASGEVRKR